MLERRGLGPIVKFRHPNLFVVGAPKCGTTSLYAYLRQHPQVFLAEPKEPNHFVYAANNPYGWKKSHPYWNLDAYLTLFQAADNAQIVGEASTCYSLMPHVPKAIREHNPDAKILAILREPVQRAWSMYLYWQQFNPACQSISIDDFRQRFLADDLMTAHEREQATRVKWLRHAGMYWHNLQHFYREFPADQIFLLQYDEFVQRPQASLKKICAFLEVDSYEFDTGFRENKTAVPKFRKLYNFVNLDVENPVRRLAKQMLGRVLPVNKLRRFANRALLNIEASKTLPESLVEELSGYYREDLQRLMDSTGFDSRPWLHYHAR